MKAIKKEDLKDVFLAIFRNDVRGRKHVPIVRRYFRSIKNTLERMPGRDVDIYFDGELIATRPKNKTRIIYEPEFLEFAKDPARFFEVQG